MDEFERGRPSALVALLRRSCAWRSRPVLWRCDHVVADFSAIVERIDLETRDHGVSESLALAIDDALESWRRTGDAGGPSSGDELFASRLLVCRSRRDSDRLGT